MRYAVDLHVHSGLSPCSDNDMTPNNIINMASIKGLDIIAITDHNSMGNIRAFIECAEESNILVVPGMEMETREEVHLICLFPEEEKALAMQELVNENLPNISNREDIFGQQLLFDKHDNITGSVEQLLVVATTLSIDEVVESVRAFGGVVIPAHVDRSSYSVISNLGAVPDSLKLNYLEISHNCDLQKFLEAEPDLSKYEFVSNSDAHTLGDILERKNFIELEEKSAYSLIQKLKKK